MLNLNTVMIGTKQPKEMSDFYAKVIGKPSDAQDSNYGYYGWKVGAAYFVILDHSEMGGMAKDPGRVIFNFETTQVKEEFERIKAVGAVVIKEPYEMGQGEWLATLADPDGNFFQLVVPIMEM